MSDIEFFLCTYNFRGLQKMIKANRVICSINTTFTQVYSCPVNHVTMLLWNLLVTLRYELGT